MPKAKAYWKGSLRLSLVSCPIALYTAVSDEKKISLNRTNKKTGNKVQQKNFDPVTQEEVLWDDIGKSYEYEKGSRVEITDDELAEIKLESSRTIKLEQFVPTDKIDPRYLSKPYYLLPDGVEAVETYTVIREAMRAKDVTAIGKVMLSTREHMIALTPAGKGIRGYLLRYPNEIRDEADYFDEIADQDVEPELIELAETLIDRKHSVFDPAQFKDRYSEALRAMVDEKVKTGKVSKRTNVDNVGSSVVNLMDMLKRSVRESGAAKPVAPKRPVVATPRASARTKNSASVKRSSSARGRKAG
jgi:DNA end-binding protein Ku